VSLYELGDPPLRLGQWTFEPRQLMPQWVGFGLIRGFVLDLPWQRIPSTGQIVVNVSFEDALTGRVFNVVEQVKANPPPVPPTNATNRP
jgi:hypothetical protein